MKIVVRNGITKKHLLRKKSFIVLVPALLFAALPDTKLKVWLGLAAASARPAHADLVLLRRACQDVAVRGLDQDKLTEESFEVHFGRFGCLFGLRLQVRFGRLGGNDFGDVLDIVVVVVVGNRLNRNKIAKSSKLLQKLQQNRQIAVAVKQRRTFATFRLVALWPDLAKFRQIGKILEVFGQSLKCVICVWQNFKPI